VTENEFGRTYALSKQCSEVPRYLAIGLQLTRMQASHGLIAKNLVSLWAEINSGNEATEHGKIIWVVENRGQISC